MKTMAHHATAAIRFGLIVLALTLLETQSSAAQGAQKPIQVTPPLWQGTPFIDHENVFFNGSALGYQCQTVFTAAAGTAVLLKMIVANYNVPTGGGGSAFVAITLPGAPYGSPLRIPMHADAPSAGRDVYSGIVDVGGFPITQAEACFGGTEGAAAGFTFIGFTVSLP